MINNFKSSGLFSQFKYIEVNQNFTNPNEYIDSYISSLYNEDSINQIEKRNEETESVNDKTNENIGTDNTINENDKLENDDPMNKNNTTNEGVTGKKTIDKHSEFKIKIFKDENEVNVEKKKFENDNLYYIMLYIFDFSSLTKYKIRFEKYDRKELEEQIKVESGAFSDSGLGNNEDIYHTVINKIIIKMLAPESPEFNISYTLLDRKGSDGSKKN